MGIVQGMSKLHSPGIWERIKLAFETVGITTQTEMAKACGVRQASVSRWAVGRNVPTLRNMIDISKRTGHEVQWLYTGEGRRMAPAGDTETDKLLTLLAGLSPEDREEVIQYAEYRAGK